MLCGGSVGLAAAIAGCTGALGRGDGGPEYEEGDKEGMGATVDAFPDGWQRDDTFNENFDRVFVNGDETIIVLTHIELFESVSDAEEGFDQSRSGFRDPQEYDIADDAFWDTQNDEMAVTMFRHSNAVGQAAAVGGVNGRSISGNAPCAKVRPNDVRRLVAAQDQKNETLRIRRTARAAPLELSFPRTGEPRRQAETLCNTRLCERGGMLHKGRTKTDKR